MNIRELHQSFSPIRTVEDALEAAREYTEGTEGSHVLIVLARPKMDQGQHVGTDFNVLTTFSKAKQALSLVQLGGTVLTQTAIAEDQRSAAVN